MAYPNDLVRTKNWGTEILTDGDLEGQLDLIINWVMTSLNATNGHTHSGVDNYGKVVSPANMVIASQAIGDTLYASSTTAWARLAKGIEGQVLTMGDSDIPEWADTQRVAGQAVQVVNVMDGAVQSFLQDGSPIKWIPGDDTIPQSDEGSEVMTLAITPTSATNKLLIQIVVNLSSTAAGLVIASLFQDTTAGALAAGVTTPDAGTSPGQVIINHYMVADTTSETTFKVRVGGGGAGTTTFNGLTAGRYFGGIMASSITITEIQV